MADSFTSLRTGEKAPVYASFATSSGTGIIQDGATFSLYDATGAVVSGLNGVSVTGFDSAESTSGRVWYELDTTSPTVLATGFYTGVFSFSVVGSDGLPRNEKATIEVRIGAVPPAEMPDYTAWPTVSDVLNRLVSVGMLTEGQSVRGGGRRLAEIVAQVPARVAQETKRQFVADPVDTTRYFDGSGTGMLEVDDMVSLTTVSVIGFFPAATGTFILSNAYLEADNNYPQNRIAIYQSSLPASTLAYVNYFPEGRKNIGVTGKFGYAATIPADLWSAVLDEEAAIMAAEQLFQKAGRLQDWTEASVTEKYLLNLPGDAAYWHLNFLRAVRDYKRPFSRNLRKMRARMV